MLNTTGVGLIDEQKEILDVFCDTEKHLSIIDVEKHLRKSQEEVPRSLIESTLDMFCRYGIATKHTFQDGRVYYEHQHLKEHHDHMICVNCGTIVGFVDPQIERLQIEAASKQHFHPLRIFNLTNQISSPYASFDGPAVQNQLILYHSV